MFKKSELAKNNVVAVEDLYNKKNERCGRYISDVADGLADLESRG